MRFIPQPPPLGVLWELRDYLNRMFRNIAQAIANPDPVWDDFVISPSSAAEGATEPPMKTLVGSIACRHFEDGPTDEELHYELQYPHGGVINGKPVLGPHLHVAPKTEDTGTACFATEYSWANVSGTFTTSTTTIIARKQLSGTRRHQIIPFDDQTLPVGISAVVVARVYRDVSEDNFSGDIALVSIDWHIKRDARGSELPFKRDAAS